MLSRDALLAVEASAVDVLLLHPPGSIVLTGTSGIVAPTSLSVVPVPDFRVPSPSRQSFVADVSMQ